MAEHAPPAASRAVPHEDTAPPAPVAAGPGATGTPAGFAAIFGMSAGLGTNAPLARRVVRGLGSSHAVGRVLARSPLSDELRDVHQTQGKGALFDRLRALNESDPDVATMVDADLAGDDLWLARNLVQHGPEAGWPLHLKVEREMKGWGDSGGKGVVFDLLRAAGAQPGNADLTASLNRVFAAGSDDIWLAANLQQHGPEAGWPIHLKVEREMKGWGDSGGKGVVFDLLRAAGGAAGNADLTATLSRVFAAGTEDLVLATLLQRYGAEGSWPAPVEEYQCPFDYAPQSSPGERIL